MNFPPTYYRTTTKPVILTKHAISKRLVFCSLNSTLPEIVNWSGVTNLLLYGQYRFSMLSKWVNGRCKRCNMNLNLYENSILQACLKCMVNPKWVGEASVSWGHGLNMRVVQIVGNFPLYFNEQNVDFVTESVNHVVRSYNRPCLYFSPFMK